MYKTVFCLLFILSISVGYTSATLSPKSPKGNKDVKPAKSEKSKTGPQNYDVFTKKLVTDRPDAKDILNNHAAFFKEVDYYNFDGIVLGYVTPWNNHGYDVAKIFGNKFTHISPVWLQVVKKAALEYDLTGTHDIDQQWVLDVKNAGRERKLKIVPRLVFEQWTGHDFTKLITEQTELDALIKMLSDTAKKYHFDGYVMEVWAQLVTRIKQVMLIEFFRSFADGLASNGLQTILVIPPRRDTVDIFSSKDFDALYNHIDGFSLMTYDYSTPLKPGPNSPIQWFEKCVKALTSDKSKRKKILAGLNFYGNDYSMSGGNTIIAHEYIDRLKNQNGNFKMDANTEEHFYEYKDKDGQHIVFYPTLYSLQKRIEKAKELGAGLSVWELGQGLDYFYDLF